MRVSILVMCLVTAALMGSVPSQALAQQPKPSPAQQGFVPIDQLPAQEQLPAPRLVMTAYAVAWIAVFGYLWSMWQRLGRVEHDIAEARRRVETGSRR